MSDFTLVIGNRNYSSWSLRGWLACRLAGVTFDEKLIPLDMPETAAALLAASPAARVPVLIHCGRVIWDTLSIAEYLNEIRPDAAMWPEDPTDRAHARSLAAEMHSGFNGIRNRCPMDIRSQIAPINAPEDVLADVQRLETAWRAARVASKAVGPYLFGRWTLADVFFAPVASRCLTYGLPLSAEATEYRDAVLAHPDMRDWCDGARLETWRIPHEDAAEQKF